MGSITVLTDDLLQEGSVKIRDTFKETSQRFDIFPHEWTLERGHELKMVAGIVNKEPDSAGHSFVVKVIPTRTSDPDTSLWIDDTEFRTPLPAQFNKILEFPITITPSSDAPAGTYVFYVIACIDDTYENCRNEQGYANIYESAQYLRVTLK